LRWEINIEEQEELQMYVNESVNPAWRFMLETYAAVVAAAEGRRITLAPPPPPPPRELVKEPAIEEELSIV
jgi:hypothetical protein